MLLHVNRIKQGSILENFFQSERSDYSWERSDYLMEQSGWNEVTMERTDRIKPYKKNFKYNASKFAQINIYV